MLNRIVSLAVFIAVPIAGLIFWGWDWRSILALYWLENISVSVQTGILMRRSPVVTAPGEAAPDLRVNGKPVQATRRSLTSMFALMTTIFTLAHGIVLAVLIFGGFIPSLSGTFSFGLAAILLSWIIGFAVQLVFTFLKPKAELPSVNTLFSQPLPRLITLHITVIAAGFLLVWLDWPNWAAIALVAVHLALDLYFEFWRKPSKTRPSLNFRTS